MSDREWMADEGAFETWYADAWPRLVRLAMGQLRVPSEAEDLAADTCAALLRRWETDRPADPMAWAVVATINAARKRGPRLRRTFGASGAAQPKADVEIDDELLEAIRRLPQRQRTAISLRYLADLTQEQVAEVMEIAPGTAGALLSQARAKLRAELEGGA